MKHREQNTVFDIIVRKLSQLGDSYALKEQVRNERIQLRELDERLLSDIGVNQADVDTEINRSYWDVPTKRQIDAACLRENYENEYTGHYLSCMAVRKF